MGSSRTARLAKTIFPNLPTSSSPEMDLFLRNLRDYCNNTFTQLQLPEYDRTKDSVLLHSVADGKVMWGGDVLISSGVATLTAGTVTVLCDATTADCLIFLSGQTTSTNAGELSVGTRVPATSFVVNSKNGSDDRVVGYLLIPVS